MSDGPAVAIVTTPKPRVWTVFATLVLAFGFSVCAFAAVFGTLAFVELGREKLPPTLFQQRYLAILARPWASAASLWGSGILWAMFAFLGARLGSRDVTARLGLRSTGGDARITATLWLGMLGIGQMGTGVGALLRVAPGGTLQMLGRTIANASTGLHDISVTGVLVVLGLGVTAAGEELFFRGFMQTRLAARWGVVGVVVSSAFFAALHWDKVHSPIAFAMGMLLGWVALRAGSIRPGIYAHVTNNLAAILVIRYVRAPPTPLGHATQIALGSLALGLSVTLLRRRLPGAQVTAGTCPALT